MARLFGTDGVRGVANIAPMTTEMVLEIGRVAAHICRRHAGGRAIIVIGRDTRLSGAMLENALTAGVCSMGVDVVLLGPMPTPGIAFLTRHMRADMGIVISASHNPFEDNGIKIFSRDGAKLPDAEEDEIENLIASGSCREIRPTGGEIGVAKRIEDPSSRYVAFCKETFPGGLSLEGMRIAMDCANGATYRVAPAVFSELGAAVETLHCAPNGTNINKRCGSQHTESLRDRVIESAATIGLAFDGDGDRLIALDEKGRELTGDQIVAICASMYKERGWLNNNLVITTVMSNFGFLVALKNLGIEHGASKVGDRYVLEMMKERGAVIGGEPSGHMIFLNHHTTGDGIISALQLLACMRQAGRPLSELAGIVTLAPQKSINVDVKEKPPLEELPALQQAIRIAERELAGKGRVLIRYSGTQPMCRVMVEGPTEEITGRLAERLAESVRKLLG